MEMVGRKGKKSARKGLMEIAMDGLSHLHRVSSPYKLKRRSRKEKAKSSCFVVLGGWKGGVQ